MSGKLVIHPAGQEGSASDPTLTYSLAPHQTVRFDDVVAEAGVQGLGSMDVVVESGGTPTIVARAYDEKGEANGTTGVSVRPVNPRRALAPGDQGSLLIAPDLNRFRMNIGIRTLSAPVRVQFRIYDASGNLRGQLGERTYPAQYFLQRPAAEFLETTIAANESVELEVSEGSVIVYATTVDNTTNDSSLQLVLRPDRP